MQIDGRAALVYGGSPLAVAVVEALMAEGVRVARVSPAPSADLPQGTPTFLVQGGDPDRVVPTTQLASDHLGAVDLAVTVVDPVGATASWDELGVADWWDAWATVGDVYAFHRHVAMRLSSAARPGRLVHVAPTASRWLAPGASDLDHVTGLAMVATLKTMAGEYGADAVTANCVLYEPEAAEGGGSWARRRRAEAACLATYLCSGQAGYLNGVTISADGGRSPTLI